MANNVYKFRRVKWADPREKLKVLSEDLQRKVWLDRLSPGRFWMLVAALSAIAFVGGSAVTGYLH